MRHLNTFHYPGAIGKTLPSLGLQTQMGTFVFGLKAALLGLFKCFEWPGQLLPSRPLPYCYWGQLGPIGNSGLIDISKEPERQRKIILYSEGQRFWSLQDWPLELQLPEEPFWLMVGE